MTTSSRWLPQDEALEIHRRLLEGDPVASADVAAAYLDTLSEWLEHCHPHIDPHLCSTAAEDAILSLIRNPASYKPEKQSLEVYLRMSATGDLKNAINSERRHRTRRASLEVVDLLPLGRNYWWERTDPSFLLEQREDVEDAVRALQPKQVPDSVRAAFTDTEAKVLKLMQDGERRTSAFADAIGIVHLAPESQRAEVKRIKDRITRRLQRAGTNDG